MRVPFGPVLKNLKNEEDKYNLSNNCRPSAITEKDKLDRTRSFQIYDNRDVRIVLVHVKKTEQNSDSDCSH